MKKLKRVLVTGANGMLGQDLCPMLRDSGFDVIETDVHNMDITKLTEVNAVIDAQKPDYIIHAAAYTNVDGAETNREAAFLINKTGSENIAKISGDMEIPVFYISTDYVFDGAKNDSGAFSSDKTISDVKQQQIFQRLHKKGDDYHPKNSPYKPDDPVNPINVYGESKLAGEIAIQKNNPKHYIFRTSWLYGHKGKNFVETMINLALKGIDCRVEAKASPRNDNILRVIDDQVGCPTWTVELSKAIASFLRDDKPYGIYHVCGSGSTSWFGFASKIMELMNINVKIKPVPTEEFPTPAQRPKYSIMDNKNICPDWKESLESYLKLRPNKQLLIKEK